MLVKGELSAEDTLTCVLGVLETETDAGVVEPFLRLASLVAASFTPVDQIDRAVRRVADRAAVSRRAAGARPGCPPRPGRATR